MPKRLEKSEERLYPAVRMKQGLYRKYPSWLTLKVMSNLDMQNVLSSESNFNTGTQSDPHTFLECMNGQRHMLDVHTVQHGKRTFLMARQDQTVAGLTQNVFYGQ